MWITFFVTSIFFCIFVYEFLAFGQNSDIYYKQQIKMEAVKEKTMKLELTESQYNHIQEILKMDKPSKTRLTRDEKDFILGMIQGDVDALSEVDEQDIQDEHYQWRIRNQQSIRKKLM